MKNYIHRHAKKLIIALPAIVFIFSVFIAINSAIHNSQLNQKKSEDCTCADSIKAILFDLDGVLVNSRVLHFETFRDALEEVIPTMKLSWADHEREFDGLSTKLKIQKLINNDIISTSQGTTLYDIKQALTLTKLPLSIKPRESLKHLLMALKNQGFRLFCCSNSIRVTLDETLRLLDIIDFFEMTYSNEDVKHPKPSPDIYELAMCVAGLSPKECLIVEDSDPGRKAAYAAGAHVLEVEDAEDVTLKLLKSTIKTIQTQGKVFPRLLPDGKSPTIHVVIPKEIEMSMGIKSFIPRKIPEDDYQIKFHILSQKSDLTRAYLTEKDLNTNDPLLIVHSEKPFEWDPDEFYKCLLNSEYNGVILAFYKPDHLDEECSFIDITNDNLVSDVGGKKLISPYATAGIYGWRKGADYVKCANQAISKNIPVSTEFDIRQIYTEAISDGQHIRIKLCNGVLSP